MTIGLIVGAIIGICGNMYHLTELAAWGQTCQFAVATAAVMAIFPKIAAIFASAFTAITDASKKAVKGSTKQREWYLAVNDALGYGETATLTTGLLLIPITLVLSFILPGNIVLPVMSFTALAYRVEINICLSDGNIFKLSLIHISLRRHFAFLFGRCEGKTWVLFEFNVKSCYNLLLVVNNFAMIK